MLRKQRGRETCHLREYRYCELNVKVLLERSNIEMSNILLETGRKMALVIKWQRTWPICVLIFFRMQNMQVMILDNFSEDIFRHSVESVAWFVSDDYSTI